MALLRLIPNSGSAFLGGAPGRGLSPDASGRGTPRLRLVSNTGSRYRPQAARLKRRSTLVLPPWVSLAVATSLAIASALVAVSGFSSGAAGLAAELNPVSGGPPPWAQPQPFREIATP
jgi:hypothetical protein